MELFSKTPHKQKDGSVQKVRKMT